MKAFVFVSETECTINETVVGTIDGESRYEILEEFKKVYYRSERTFEDYPDLGYAEICSSTDNDASKFWRVYI